MSIVSIEFVSFTMIVSWYGHASDSWWVDVSGASALPHPHTAAANLDDVATLLSHLYVDTCALHSSVFLY